jgi:hypothetical protein
MTRAEREAQLTARYESLGARSTYDAPPMREGDKRRDKGRWVYRVDDGTRHVIGRKMRISDAATRFGLTPQGIYTAATHNCRAGQWRWRFACGPRKGQATDSPPEPPTGPEASTEPQEQQLSVTEAA